MSDDNSNPEKAERNRIDVSEDHQCQYWAEKFGVSTDELKLTVYKVGPRVEDVARTLGKLADLTSITTVYRVCPFLLLLGFLTAFLPRRPGRLHEMTSAGYGPS